MEGLTKLIFSPNGRAGEPEGLLLMVPGALAGVPSADNRTEILSPTNKQYKGRKRALRAFQGPQGGVPGGFRRFQGANARSKRFQVSSFRRFQKVPEV